MAKQHMYAGHAGRFDLTKPDGSNAIAMRVVILTEGTASKRDVKTVHDSMVNIVAGQLQAVHAKLQSLANESPADPSDTKGA